jgi:hypothetical protein
MNHDEEAAVAVLLGIKRSVVAPVIDGGCFYSVPTKQRSCKSPGSNDPNRKRSRLSESLDVSKSRQRRKKTLNKAKVARHVSVKRSSEQGYIDQLNSPVSVTSSATLTHHPHMEIQKISSLVPTASQDSFSGLYNPSGRTCIRSSTVSQATPNFPPQANVLAVVGGTLLQQQLMALAKQVSPQDIASALLFAEIENLKAQIAAQQRAQSSSLLSSLPYLLPNMQKSAPVNVKVEGMESNSAASALIASLVLQTCSNTAS